MTISPGEIRRFREEDGSVNSATAAAVGWALPNIWEAIFQKSPKVACSNELFHFCLTSSSYKEGINGSQTDSTD